MSAARAVLPAPGLGRRRFTTTPAVIALCVLLGVLAGCTGAATPTATGTISANGAWIRVAPTTDTPTAAYLVIANSGSQPDALLGVTSTAATTIEIHETSMDSGGMAGMHPVERIEVPAGGTARLEPGGFHLMVMGLKNPLAAGGKVDLDLLFEHAGHVVVQADVRAG